MAGTRTNRRQFLNSAAAAGVSATMFASPLLSQGAGPHLVVIGGGFAGATCARALKKAAPHLLVTMVEANPVYTAPPMSNAVIAGLRALKLQQFEYAGIAARRHYARRVGGDGG